MEGSFDSGHDVLYCKIHVKESQHNGRFLVLATIEEREGNGRSFRSSMRRTRAVLTARTSMSSRGKPSRVTRDEFIVECSCQVGAQSQIEGRDIVQEKTEGTIFVSGGRDGIEVNMKE
jgi:hypothetical protein